MSASDWFALGLDGSLGAGLDKVLSLQDSKTQFVRALKQALANPIPHAPDRLSLLHDEIKSLDKTLRLRVSILPLDRPQAWFRCSAAREKSPIATAGLSDPIFTAFDEAQATAVRHIIPELWRQKITGNDIYDPAHSLWGRLLLLNKRFHQLNQMPPPFPDILLEDLPEALPDELASPALERFGQQISLRVRACGRDLEACYAFLWARSESFLYAQYVYYVANKAKGQSKASQNDSPRPPPPHKRPLSPVEEALKFMNFSRLPAFSDLRQRYRVMAQTLHPDLGGNEERFKLLSQHYQSLLKHVQRFS